MSLRLVCRIAFFLVLAVMVGASLARNHHVVMAIGAYDKPAHLIVYFALALLATMGWPRRRRMILVILLVGGLVLEVAQNAIGRSFDWLDALANVVGVGLAAALTRWLDRK